MTQTVLKNETDDEEPELLTQKIGQIIKKLKKNKSPGHDKITNGHIKVGEEPIIIYLKNLFNEILRAKKIPHDWSLLDT